MSPSGGSVKVRSILGYMAASEHLSPHTERREREYITGYLMDGRTIDLIKEHASRCGRPEAHDVHWPDLKAGEGAPAVPVAGTYTCPGVPPQGEA
jgi:hypothetical protein